MEIKMGRLFGTDGIRGIAGETLTALTAYRLGAALAQVLRENGAEAPKVLIGMDTRCSGSMLESAISAGLMAGGADACLLGITTTPAVAFLIRKLACDAGVMISASHNPAQYNGLKVFGSDGYKLSDEDEARIECMILGEIETVTVGWERIGRLFDCRAETKQYEEHVIAILRENGPLVLPAPKRILFDLSHGSACATAEHIFTAANMFGYEADFLSAEPDGSVINQNCGSTHLSALSKAVKDGGYDMGFAFDGDADRCLAVDEKGNTIDGDMLIAVLAKDRRKRAKQGSDTAVVTVLTNLGFHLYCRENGIEVAVTDVGDRFVLREMLRIGAGIGGEQSGHIILTEYATTGDGQVTAAVALGLLARSDGKKASEVFGEMKPLPQTSKNVVVAQDEKARVLANPALAEIKERVTAQLNGKGRVLIRPSGTEALIRIMLEGERQEEIEELAEKIAETVNRICGAQ